MRKRKIRVHLSGPEAAVAGSMYNLGTFGAAPLKAKFEVVGAEEGDVNFRFVQEEDGKHWTAIPEGGHIWGAEPGMPEMDLFVDQVGLGLKCISGGTEPVGAYMDVTIYERAVG